MQSKLNKITAKNELLFSVLPYLIFFAGSFIYFGFFVDYIFFYQEKSALFISSFDFLVENLHQPGGILLYLGKFFSTFFYYPLAGAMIVSAVLTLIILTISKIINFLTGKSGTVFPFTIGIIFFYLQTDYRFLLINSLGVLLQLAFFYLAVRYIMLLRGWMPVIFTPFLYFVTGGFVWLYCLMLACYLVFNKENRGWVKIAILVTLMLITLYISKQFLFFQTEKTLLTFPFSALNTGSQSLLFLVVSVILSILPLLAGIKFRMPDKIGVSGLVIDLITTTILAISLFIIGFQRFDLKMKQYFHVEKLFYQHKFDELIAYNTANPSSNSLTIFLNNIALCESGQLNDLLFHFRQSPDGKTLFLKWEMVEEVLKRGGYFYYTIGMVNEAHRWAFENMVMKGQSPEGLKMLIRTELINGNYKMASKYIALLKNTLFYNHEAVAFEKLLFDDNAINADKELGEKRHNRIETDFFSITDDPFGNIDRSLASDSLNKMAFEYKLAFMLLKKDYKAIAHELPNFERFGFKKLPLNIEEVAVALPSLKMGKLPDLGPITINKNTEQQWRQYLAIFKQYGNNANAAEPELKRQFGNTFWYYVFYR